MRVPPAKDVFLGSVIGLVGLAVISGLVLLGSPGEARTRRLDSRRVADLDEIALAANLYRTRHDRLPRSVQELSQDPDVRLRPLDPTTHEPYEYRVRDSVTFEVCAHFERASAVGPDEEPERLEGPAWTHGAGRQCFERKAPVPAGAPRRQS